MNKIDNLITEERKAVLKEVATLQFEDILKNLKSEKLNEAEQVFTMLEICEKLNRYCEKEKVRLVGEAPNRDITTTNIYWKLSEIFEELNVLDEILRKENAQLFKRYRVFLFDRIAEYMKNKMKRTQYEWK